VDANNEPVAYSKPDAMKDSAKSPLEIWHRHKEAIGTISILGLFASPKCYMRINHLIRC